MVETALAAAMKKAGMDTDEARLFNAAVEALRKHDGNAHRALHPFTETVRLAMGMARRLFSEEETRTRAMRYLINVSDDMRGSAAGSNPPKEGGSVLSSPDSQWRNGASDKRDGRVLRPGASATVYHGSSSRGGAALFLSDNQLAPGRAASLPRGLSAFTAMSRLAGPSIFDTYKVRHIPVGDIRFGELTTMISVSKRETALLDMIRSHAQVANGSMKVRDVIKLADLQLMIQKAAEISDE